MFVLRDFLLLILESRCASPAGPYFLLLRQKKVSQEKATRAVRRRFASVHSLLRFWRELRNSPLLRKASDTSSPYFRQPLPLLGSLHGGLKSTRRCAR